MKRYPLLLLFLISVLFSWAQTRNCGTMEHLEFLKSQDPLLEERMQNNENNLQDWIENQTESSSSTILTIPVVVHVVYYNSNENISTAQVQSQIDILNEDFRRLNTDASNTPSAFQSVAADCEIEFCLATTDPNGNTTTGITRTSTSQSSFSTNDNVMFTSSGGINAWNTSEYLNIWVCDLGGGLLGYAQFPGGNSNTDGVVCDYAYFGNTGTATSPYHLGRTATHEVGHYLNLWHIWGSGSCGNDYCNDTPTQQSSNSGCPSFPSTSSCSGNGSNGDMFMNYMDYTYDACMNIFTQDQKTRMIAAINTSRSGLLSSNGCQGNNYGCTDPNAINYNPLATVDDGSCTYCTTTLPYSEDFNNGVGSWTNTGSAGNWSLNSGGTPSNSTGPTSGNSGSGNYMYIESSSPNYPNVGPFTLTSECFDLSNSTNPSLSFYYNMYGAAMGTLNVYANSSLIWSLSGNQGQGWNLVQIPLTSVGNTLIIEFEGTTGSSYTSDIAIDDINIIGIQQVNGCTDPNAINYNPNATVDDGSCIYPLVVSVTGNNLSCNGSNDGFCAVAVSGGQTPYTYSWNTGQTTSSINNLSAGTYTVTVTDASGQTQTSSYTITEPSAITIIYSVTNVSSAGGNDGSINITPTGGVTPYLYYWDTNPTQTTQNINNLIAGTYTVWVVDANGCIGTVSITVNENIIITCGAITGVYMSDVIHDRASFNWDNMNSSVCNVDQIRIRYREVGTSGYTNKTMGAPVGSGCNTANISKRILGFSPSTTYEYDFKLWYCGAPTINWHAAGTFTTAAACDNVTNVTAIPNSATQTVFCWTNPASHAFVRLQYRENVPGSSFSNIGGFGVMAPATCKTKNGLTPGTQYRVMYRTWCNAAGGPYRSPVWDGPVIWTQPSGVRLEGENTAITNLEVYPNPSRDIFNVSFVSDEVQNLKIRIVNLLGEAVFVDEKEKFIGQYSKAFNLNPYPKGIYMLEIETNSGVVNKKLILQ
jgi:hypothetical protein